RLSGFLTRVTRPIIAPGSAVPCAAMPPTGPLRRIAVAVLLGLAVGLFSSRADLLPADTLLHVVVVMGNAVGPWVAVGFAAGALQGEMRRGAVGGAVALCVGVVTYYGAAVLT